MKYKAWSTLLSVVCLFLFCGASTSTAPQTEEAMPVTILKANIAERTVLVKNLDGKLETIQFASGVSATSIAEAGMNQRLAGGAGYQFVIVFSMKNGQKIITAFHYSGKNPWMTVRGSVEKINALNKTILFKTEEGTEVSFQVGPNCVMNTSTGVKSFKSWTPLETWNEKEMIAYYMQGTSGGILHLLKPYSH